MSHTYEYPRAALTVDCVVFGYDSNDLQILLIKRGQEPFLGEWALPGGFVRIEETLEEAALRELREETGVEKIFLEQLYTFGKIDRDPRERVVSVAYYALIPLMGHELVATTDAESAAWFKLDAVPELAFDHQEILRIALQRLKGKVNYQPIGFHLLPEKFKLSQLQLLYEVILERPLDKRNFRKKILRMGVLEELDETEKDVAHRAARLYRFDKQEYDKLLERGINPVFC